MNAETTGPSINEIFRSMDHAVIGTDKKGLVTFVNRSAEHLVGQPRKQVLGCPLRELLLLKDGLKGTGVRIPSVRSFQKQREPFVVHYARLVNREDQQIPVQVVVSPIRGTRGAITGCVVVLNDITECLAFQRESCDREKMGAIGTMAGNVGSDLGNWLTVISGHASSISDNLLPKTRAHEDALRILEVVEHAGELSKRLLSIARASSGKGGPRPAAVSLADVVRDAVSLLESSFEERRVQFKTKTLNAPYVMAEEGQLLDCLINLFLNSADAMPNGGSIMVDVSERRDGDDAVVILRVRDTGCGFAREVAEHMFEPFYSTKSPGSAVGLGLTVVRSVIRSWGGDIKVRSQPGHGASFRLFLPKAPVQPEAPSEQTRGGETLLVIDDKEALLGEAAELLEAAGYKVHRADSGESGLQLFRKHAADISLCVIDVVMPGKDGKAVVAEILALDPTAQIVMTSGFSREYVRGYLERGAWGFVQKPFDRELLLSTVRRMLDQKHGHATGVRDAAPR